jgi:hypothetical protein
MTLFYPILLSTYSGGQIQHRSRERGDPNDNSNVCLMAWIYPGKHNCQSA